MAYSPDLDKIKLEVTTDTDLVVYVASYDGGPDKVRIMRRGKNGKTYPCHSVGVNELGALIDALNTVANELGFGSEEEE